jgi:hypothetical protein
MKAIEARPLGPTVQDVAGGSKKPNNEEDQHLYSSWDIIRVEN